MHDADIRRHTVVNLQQLKMLANAFYNELPEATRDQDFDTLTDFQCFLEGRLCVDYEDEDIE